MSAFRNPLGSLAVVLAIPFSMANCVASESAPAEDAVKFEESNLAAGEKLAFPTAEGYGRLTVGGRGGKVIEVTNLNDSGPGSLRAALLDRDPRTVVFRVSGTIRLASKLYVTSPYITIAGQTAPGDGICVAGHMFEISADQVIIRHLRFRSGDVARTPLDTISGRGHSNIILDHVSASWGIDENLSLYGASDTRNITVQWSIISESLNSSLHTSGEHGMGGIWGASGSSYHHNLLAHNASRNPRLWDGLIDVRNNVVYNWGYYSAYGGGSGRINMVGNYYKPGPGTQPGSRSWFLEPSVEAKWFVDGNFLSGYPAISADNWAGGVRNISATVRARIGVSTPFAMAPVRTQTAGDAFAAVLRHAGASRPRRDSVDARIVREVESGTATYGGTYAGPRGGIIDTQATVGGWPTLSSAPAPADRDRDGMPDAWEVAHRLNADDPSDRNGYTLDPSYRNYTNLEVYLNSLVDEHPRASMEEPRTVVGEASSKCMDVRGARTGDGVAVVQYRCNGAANQDWFLLPFGDGTYTIVSQRDGRCLQVAGASTADGALVQQWACNGGESQRWIVESDAGVTRLRNKRSNKCLNVPGASRSDDVQLQQRSCNADSSQRFSFAE